MSIPSTSSIVPDVKETAAQHEAASAYQSRPDSENSSPGQTLQVLYVNGDQDTDMAPRLNQYGKHKRTQTSGTSEVSLRAKLLASRPTARANRRSSKTHAKHVKKMVFLVKQANQLRAFVRELRSELGQERRAQSTLDDEYIRAINNYNGSAPAAPSSPRLTTEELTKLSYKVRDARDSISVLEERYNYFEQRLKLIDHQLQRRGEAYTRRYERVRFEDTSSAATESASTSSSSENSEPDSWSSSGPGYPSKRALETGELVRGTSGEQFPPLDSSYHSKLKRVSHLSAQLEELTERAQAQDLLSDQQVLLGPEQDHEGPMEAPEVLHSIRFLLREVKTSEQQAIQLRQKALPDPDLARMPSDDIELDEGLYLQHRHPLLFPLIDGSPRTKDIEKKIRLLVIQWKSPRDRLNRWLFLSLRTTGLDVLLYHLFVEEECEETGSYFPGLRDERILSNAAIGNWPTDAAARGYSLEGPETTIEESTVSYQSKPLSRPQSELSSRASEPPLTTMSAENPPSGGEIDPIEKAPLSVSSTSSKLAVEPFQNLSTTDAILNEASSELSKFSLRRILTIKLQQAETGVVRDALKSATNFLKYKISSYFKPRHPS